MIVRLSVILLITISQLAPVSAQQIVEAFLEENRNKGELITVNIDKSTMRILADLKEGKDKSDFIELTKSIKSITIVSNPLKSDSGVVNFDTLSARLGAVKAFECILKMDQNNERVLFYVRSAPNNMIAEFIMVSNEPHLQTLMHIKGRMKLEDIAHVSSLMNIDLSKVMPQEHK